MRPGVTLGGCLERDVDLQLAEARALGARAIRLRLAPIRDLEGVLLRARGLYGLAVLGVIDPTCFGADRDWRRLGPDNPLDVTLARASRLAEHGCLDAVAIGQEPDDGWAGPLASDDPLLAPRGGVGSWVLSTEDLNQVIERTRRALYGQCRLVIGGLSSGQAAFVDRLDLDAIDAIAVHPYGTRPSRTWPSETWGGGFVGDYLDDLQARLAARGLGGRVALGIGELGISTYQSTRDLATEWYGRMLAYLRARGDLAFCFLTAVTEAVDEGYGLFDHRGQIARPLLEAITAVTGALPEVPFLDGPPRGPEPVAPYEPLAWTDPDFDARHLAGQMAVPLERLQAAWSAFGPWLEAVGCDRDPAVRIGLLATIAVEARDWSPPVEAGDYADLERQYGHLTLAGQVLGNVEPGDGSRYRRRGYWPLRGRAAYAAVGEALDLPLLAQPHLAADPYVAAGVLVNQAIESGLAATCRLGNWEQARRLVDPAVNHWDLFLAQVQGLVELLEASQGPDPAAEGPAASTLLAPVVRAAYRVGEDCVGAPFAWSGQDARGFDAGGLVAFCYAQSVGRALPEFADLLWAETEPLGPQAAGPGDLIFYEYFDPTTPSVRFPHVGLVTTHHDLVLDARGGRGVGPHEHIQGAVRHYRRVRGLTVGDEDMVYRERYEACLAALVGLADEVGDDLAAVVAGALGLEAPPEPPHKVEGKKPVMDDFRAYARAGREWSARALEVNQASVAGLERARGRLAEVREQFAGPRVVGTLVEEQADGQADEAGPSVDQEAEGGLGRGGADGVEGVRDEGGRQGEPVYEWPGQVGQGQAVPAPTAVGGPDEARDDSVPVELGTGPG